MMLSRCDAILTLDTAVNILSRRISKAQCSCVGRDSVVANQDDLDHKVDTQLYLQNTILYILCERGNAAGPAQDAFAKAGSCSGQLLFGTNVDDATREPSSLDRFNFS